MDDSRKDSNKTVIKPSAIPKLLPSSSDLKQKIVTTRRESNENEEELITNHINYSSSSKLQNPKKPSTPKHFMSPTISAASKISTPKKKILMERNDFSFSETSSTTTHVSKTPNLDSKTPNSSSQIQLPQKILDFSVPPNLQSSQITPISSKLTDSEETPYDPKTNFLSPRPKFLRFNPNRRMEILKRREEELKQQAEQSCSDDLSSSSQGDESGLSSTTTSEEESITKKGPSEHAESEVEIEDEEEDEVDEEEEVEKNGFLWNLYQVLKFLLLVGFVGFSTSYISSMNAPNLQLQPVCDVKQGFKIFENGLCPSGLEKSVLWNVSSNPELVMKKASIVKEVELEKSVEFPVQIEDGVLIGMTQVSLESGGEDDDKVVVLTAEEEVVEDENVKPGEVEISYQVVEILEMIEEENVESVSLSNQLSENLELAEIVLENTVEDNEGNGEVAEQFESPEPASDEVVGEESEAPEPISNVEIVEEDVQEFEASEETVSNEDVAPELVSYEDVAEDPEASKPVSNEVSEEAEASIPVPNEVAGEAEALRRVAKVELGIGVSVISAILASLIIVFRHLKHRRQAVNECAPTMGPPAEAFLTEEQETIIAETLEKAKKCYLPKKDEVAEGRIEKAAESYIDTSFHSSGRVSEDLYRSRAAPSVQLLGELIVEESGSSLRICSVLNSKAIEDGEESKFSVSMSGMNSRGRRGASSIMQEDLSEFSNADSHSYGSFTTQEKLTRKDGGDFTTPVRRSSRIRTKSVMSS
ncbi:hypothetical protein MKX03_012138 [Papaver bracteatum]|nr:hypothetical protein MKX03_012138 [Papaver bracteatum]